MHSGVGRVLCDRVHQNRTAPAAVLQQPKPEIDALTRAPGRAPCASERSWPKPLVVGPRWTGAALTGVKKVFRSTTDLCLGFFRPQLFDAADIEHVNVAARLVARALHDHLCGGAAAATQRVFWSVTM